MSLDPDSPRFRELFDRAAEEAAELELERALDAESALDPAAPALQLNDPEIVEGLSWIARHMELMGLAFDFDCDLRVKDVPASLTPDALEGHLAELLRQGRSRLREHPEARIVGVILDGDEAILRASLRAALLPPATDQNPIIAALDREVVLDAVSVEAPHALYGLPDEDEEGRPRLPLIISGDSALAFGSMRI